MRVSTICSIRTHMQTRKRPARNGTFFVTNGGLHTECGRALSHIECRCGDVSSRKIVILHLAAILLKYVCNAPQLRSRHVRSHVRYSPSRTLPLEQRQPCFCLCTAKNPFPRDRCNAGVGAVGLKPSFGGSRTMEELSAKAPF